jgi:hypothetical protein
MNAVNRIAWFFAGLWFGSLAISMWYRWRPQIVSFVVLLLVFLIVALSTEEDSQS